MADPKWHDPIMAGYWIWACSCWIGSGMLSIGQRPHISNTDMGVHKISQIPHVGGQGKGVHKISQIPGKCGTDKHVQEPYNGNIYKWFRELSERLRYIRVVCGDWTRVCGGNWQDNMGTVGIFFDPPYGAKATRCENIYSEDSLTVADEVNKWALERGQLPLYRIVLAGYFEEHENLIENGWTVHRWKARGGYANSGKGKTRGNDNRHREALFFSPNCINFQHDPILGLGF